MRKRKVLVDIYYLQVAQTGIKTYIECLCEEIDKGESDDFEFIVTPNFKKIQKRSFFKGKTALWKNLLFQFLYFSRKMLVLPLLSIRYNAAVVFSPDILSPIWARGLKVSVIHDAFFWENPSHYNPIWLKTYLTLLRWSLRRNAQVVTISEYSKKQLLKYLKMPHLPVHVVYPSTNIQPKEGGIKLQAPVLHPYFLYVGVMEKRKNLLTLISAFAGFINRKEFRSFKLVLVGQRGPRKTLDDWEPIVELVKQLNLRESVILPGFVKAGELERYYFHALAYVFPSLNEGFGMPILEAFSFGLPVIIANQGSLTELGGDAVLVVKENTPEGFEQALNDISRDKKLRGRLKTLGYERLKIFSPANFFLSLQDCFRKILHE